MRLLINSRSIYYLKIKVCFNICSVCSKKYFIDEKTLYLSLRLKCLFIYFETIKAQFNKKYIANNYVMFKIPCIENCWIISCNNFDINMKLNNLKIKLKFRPFNNIFSHTSNTFFGNDCNGIYVNCRLVAHTRILYYTYTFIGKYLRIKRGISKT